MPLKLVHFGISSVSIFCFGKEAYQKIQAKFTGLQEKGEHIKITCSLKLVSARSVILFCFSQKKAEVLEESFVFFISETLIELSKVLWALIFVCVFCCLGGGGGALSSEPMIFVLRGLI